MTRARTENVVVRASNNIYTALAGVGLLAVLLALVLISMRWYSTWSELTDGAPLFFGLF